MDQTRTTPITMNEARGTASPLWRSQARAQVARYVPISGWLRAYRREDLGPDLIGGLSSWAVMVPVALAYASLAGVPAAYGLITAFAALAAYAVFGTSRQIKVTTSSTMAVTSFSIVAPLAGGDSSSMVALSAALALMVGVILIIAGFLRLGFISEFLAKPVVTGFVIGVAVTIIVGQLSKVLGVPGTSGSVPDQLVQLAGELDETHLATLVVALISFVTIIVIRRFAPRLPAGLIAVVLGTVITVSFGLVGEGVAVVGPVTTGFTGLGLPPVGLGDLTYLLTGALGLVFLVVGESVSSARALALRHGQQIDSNQELVALGAANGTVGLFSGFTVDASLSQSAASEDAGARTQLSSLVTSGLVLLTLLFLAPLFENLPQATLGVVVIVSAVSLIDVDELRRYWHERRTDALLAVAAMIGVATTDVLTGLLIAVLLSLLLLLYRASRPYIAVLGRLPGERDVFVDVSRHPDARPVAGMLLLRLDAPLYFFNVTVAREQILGLVDSQSPRPSVVIVDLGATADLDVTTGDMLGQLISELEERGVSLSIAQAKGAVRDRLRHTGLMDRIARDNVYFSMAQAVAVEASDLSETSAGSQHDAKTDPRSPPQAQIGNGLISNG